MAKKIIIDDSCIGCGNCAEIAGEYFVIKNEKSHVKKQYSSDDADIIEEAVKECPVDAIKIIEE